MGQIYNHVSSYERNFIQNGLNRGLSIGLIARDLQRPRSTIWREIRRNSNNKLEYDARKAVFNSFARRRRGLFKLREGTALRDFVLTHIRQAWSPEQISGKISSMLTDPSTGQTPLSKVSHETIYKAIYVIPRNELRKELIGFHRTQIDADCVNLSALDNLIKHAVQKA